jgi:alkylhydroperoxidase/carboxymuconolactone decarboxylase family protein YurZ
MSDNAAQVRSLTKLATPIARHRTDELPLHPQYALGNGAAREELVAMDARLACCAGWPAAGTAVGVGRKICGETGPEE